MAVVINGKVVKPDPPKEEIDKINKEKAEEKAKERAKDANK